MQLNPPKRETKIPPPKVPQCFICYDKGFVLVYTDDSKEMLTYCTCEQGVKYQYDGRTSEKNKSPFYVACVADCIDHTGLAKEQYKKFVKDYGHHPEVKRQLEKRMKEVS